MKHRLGFTLVEVMIVVAVMALLAGLAALSFSGPLRRSQAREAVERVRVLDETTRQHCRRTGRPARMVLDLSEGRQWREAAGSQTIAQWSSMPGACRIEQVRVGGSRIESGHVDLDVSAAGLSRSYAVHVSGPEIDRWIVVAGLSGQVTVVDDETQVEQILKGRRRQPR